MVNMRSNSFSGKSDIKRSIEKRRASESDVDKVKKELNIHTLREQVLEHENELKSKSKKVEEQMQQLQELRRLIEEDDDKSEYLMKAIIKQNGTRFNSQEIELITRIKNSKDIEYKISGLSTLINVKEQEAWDINDYIGQYEDLRKSIEIAIKEGLSNSKEEFRNRFDIIKLSEENFRDISKMKNGFERVCEESKFDNMNKFEGCYFYDGKIRDNKFEHLYKKIKSTNNKYLNLLLDMTKYGKQQEKSTDKYIIDKRESIINCIEEALEQFEDRTEDIKQLESKLNRVKKIHVKDMTRLSTYIKLTKGAIKLGSSKYGDVLEGYKLKNKKELRDYIKFGKDILKSGIITLRESVELKKELTNQLKIKKLEELKELKELIGIFNKIKPDGYKKYEPLKEIDRRQKILDEAQTFLCDAVKEVGSIIEDSKKSIELKVYCEKMLQKNINKGISAEDEHIEKIIENNKKQENRLSLGKRLIEVLKQKKNLLKSILTGTLKFRTIRLSMKVSKIKSKHDRISKNLAKSTEQIINNKKQIDNRQSIKPSDIENISKGNMKRNVSKQNIKTDLEI